MKTPKLTMIVALIMISAGLVLAADGKRPPKAPPRGGDRGGIGQRPGGGGGLAGLDLTEEQKAQIAEIRKKYMKLMKEEINAVLTEEQQARLQDRDPGLSQEQKTRLKTLHESHREKMRAAETPEEKKALMEQMKAEMSEFLTEDQIEKLKRMRQNRRPESGPDGRRPHDRPGPRRTPAGPKEPAVEF